MKNKIIFLLFIAVLFSTIQSIKGQNLVLNPGFEDYSACPDSACTISNATGWYNISGYPSYFNSCGSNGYGVPYNKYGYQQAASGNGYAEFDFEYGYATFIDDVGGQLDLPLIVGHKYFVNFKISLAGISSVTSNRMGIGFSKNPYYWASINSIACGWNYQWDPSRNIIYSDSIISDSINWTTISGSFVADSAYRYFMIGYFGFLDSVNISPITMPAFALYYLDDVCVSTDSMTCLTTDIPDIRNSFDILNIFPNPASSTITISTPLQSTNAELSIMNIQGQLLLKQALMQGKAVVDVSGFAKGMYFVKVSGDKGVAVKKFLKN